MATYSRLNQHEIQQLADTYKLGEVIDFKLLDGGSENTNYLTSTVEGRFVITICEQKTAVEARQLAALLTHLKAHQFKSSEVVLNENQEPISFLGEKPVMVKHFLEGKIMELLPLHLLELLGKELGALHQIPAPTYLPNRLAYGIEEFDDVALYANHSPFQEWLNKKKTYFKTYLSEELPKTLIHSDLFFSNVIVNELETQAVIMDFEEATYYYRLFDVGMTIVGLCRDENALDEQRAKALLTGYRSVILLSGKEEQSLQAFVIYAATAMCFWRHRNFNYVQPDPDYSDHYQALQQTADFAESLSPDFFK